MYNKRQIVILIATLFSVMGWSQQCNHLITGIIKSAETKEVIPFANILIESEGKGGIAGSNGRFEISHLCHDKLDVHVSCLGYEDFNQVIDLDSEVDLEIYLTPQDTQISGVTIVGNSLSSALRQSQQLTDSKIQQKANQNIGEMLGGLSGVSVLKSGGGIAKPVVQGNYGNRLTILNNGIAQSGQQWGNDHSPEIDPLAANQIQVIKGVKAIQYQGKTLGDMVLVEAGAIKRQDKMSGFASYFFESNGLGNGVNLQLQKFSPTLAWKVNGTLKKRGDQQAANYYLTNTGVEEANVSVQLEKVLDDQWTLDAHLSSFNTQLGVLRGSHIGNLTDLKEALGRDVPFYTNDYFSYKINAPRQTVNHHLMKLQARYFINDDKWLNVSYALQLNNRKEYDVKRSGRSDIPSLSLYQSSHFFESKYTSSIFNVWRLKTGVQFNFINNTNNPETGVLPLIPDYYSYEGGYFASLSRKSNRWQWDLGGRYDYQIQNVAAISYTVPREIIRYNNHFHSFKVAADTRYYISSKAFLSGSVVYASRNPEVNELYSNGLHQGVGGIEEGDPNLVAEHALKGTLTLNADITSKLQFESSLYSQLIDNYIFLNPQDEIRLTIRGAFPVFKYEQTDAHIYGADFVAHYHFTEQFKISGQYSYLRGHNLSDDMPLINMPSNNISSSISFFDEALFGVEKLSIDLTQQYVFKQKHLLAEQDYILPPDDYFLLGIKVSGQKSFDKFLVHSYLKVDNLLNVSYRDYLNRMRYFADDLGRNIVVGVKVEF